MSTTALLDAQRDIARGCQYPYNGRHPTDWAEMAALGIFYDLNDRAGLKHALATVTPEVREVMVTRIAAIIRAATGPK